MTIAKIIQGRSSQDVIGCDATTSMREAVALLAEKRKRVRDAATDKKHSTGVRGINLVRRPSPAFRVQVQTNGKSHVREFSVKRLGAEKAWREATKFLAECRGYKSAPKAWKDRMPKVKGAK